MLNEASALMSNGEWDRTTSLIDKALEIDPDLFMGYAFLTLNDAVNANEEGIIDKALAIDSKNFNQAELLLRDMLVQLKGDPTSPCTETFKALVAAYPNNIQALESAGANAYFADQNLELSLQYGRKLANLSPGFPSTYNMLGYGYMELGDMVQAKANFETYLKLSPNEANPYDSMADYLMATKDFKRAAEYYDMAVARGMTSSQARADKARKMQMQSTKAFNLRTARTEINAANRSFMGSFFTGDTVGIANAYTTDCKVMFTGAPAVVGRANIMTLFSGLKASGITHINIVTTGVFGTEELLAEEGEVTVYKNDKVIAEDKYLVLWKQEAGQWKMFRDIANSNKPAK